MAGENLREGGVEVAFEPWTQRAQASVGSTGVSTVIRESDMNVSAEWRQLARS